jgi:hypothetical protein
MAAAVRLKTDDLTIEHRVWARAAFLDPRTRERCLDAEALSKLLCLPETRRLTVFHVYSDYRWTVREARASVELR